METQRQRYRMAVSFRPFASSSASSPPQLAPARFDPERTRPGNTNTYTHTTPLDTHIIIATSALLFLLLAVLFLNFVIRWLLRRFYHSSLFPSHDSQAQKPSDAQKGLTKTQLQSLPTLVFSYASEVSDKTHVLSIKIESRTDKEDTVAASTCGGEAKEGKEDHLSSVGIVESQNERDPGVVDDDDDSSSSSCPICLAKFVSGEIIRVLPTCHHRFHSNCIDTWLSKHSSCPACRADLIVATKHTRV